jgi:hypothetical protein
MTTDAEENEPVRDCTEAEIDEWIKFMGGEDDDGTPTVNFAVVSWADKWFAGPGWYVYMEEYPEEGSVFLTSQRDPTPRIAQHLKEVG